jgi:glutaredoxin
MITSLKVHNPELAKEWHPTKNQSLTAADVSKGTNRKVWWECPKGHSYEASVNNRSRGSGCPFCSGRMSTPDNSLAVKNPEIAREWHPTKNGGLNPKDVSYGSGQNVWWKCPVDALHEWQAKISARTKEFKPTGCPYCKGNRLIADQNSLAAKTPAIAKEWHPTLNKNLTPSDVRNGSPQKSWWLCSQGHTYQAQIGNRTKRVNPSSCPYCANKLATETTSLAALGGDLLQEWDEVKNYQLDPNRILAGSHIKVWWRCRKDHSWEAQIKSRVNGAGCPFCSNQSSTPEVRLLSELESVFNDAISRHRQEKVEIDIFIPSLNIGIEYDGSYYHKNKNGKDAEKTTTLRGLGIELVRVRELPLEKLSSNDIQVSQQGISKDNVDELLNSIIRIAGSNASSEVYKKAHDYMALDDFANDELFRKYVECFPDPLPRNSLQETHPALVQEWHPTRNSPLNPKNFTPGSNAKVWWICPLRHEYETQIISRTTGHGCPVCSGNTVNTHNALSTTHPDLVKEWHSTQNGALLPTNVSRGSTKNVWWICGTCSHEWQAVIYNRSKTNNPSGCPRCWDQRRKGLPRQRGANRDN